MRLMLMILKERKAGKGEKVMGLLYAGRINGTHSSDLEEMDLKVL